MCTPRMVISRIWPWFPTSGSKGALDPFSCGALLGLWDEVQLHLITEGIVQQNAITLDVFLLCTYIHIANILVICKY